MTDDGDRLHVEFWVPVADPATVAELLRHEARMLPSRSGLRLGLAPGEDVRDLTPSGEDGAAAAATGTSLEDGISIEWPALSWEPGSTPAVVQIRVGASEGGSSVTLDVRGLGRHLGASESSDLVGWFVSEILRPVVRAPSPDRASDWWTDRRARSPSGERSRAGYSDPIYHRPNFLAILDRIGLSRDDMLLEVGCGGGAFLRDALESGCRAYAIDHSPEMVATTRALNRAAIEDGRLEVREADAHSLPFPDRLCTVAVSTGVLHFLDDPVRALSEVRRVLRPGGRLCVFIGSKELRGTPAAPEPMASRLHWYEDEELVALARAAGFADARVDRPDLEPYARRVGVPPEAMPLFAAKMRGGQMLEAERPRSD